MIVVLTNNIPVAEAGVSPGMCIFIDVQVLPSVIGFKVIV
jgi:hypothetical protein